MGGTIVSLIIVATIMFVAQVCYFFQLFDLIVNLIISPSWLLSPIVSTF